MMWNSTHYKEIGFFILVGRPRNFNRNNSEKMLPNKALISTEKIESIFIKYV